MENIEATRVERKPILNPAEADQQPPENPKQEEVTTGEAAVEQRAAVAPNESAIKENLSDADRLARKRQILSELQKRQAELLEEIERERAETDDLRSNVIRKIRLNLGLGSIGVENSRETVKEVRVEGSANGGAPITESDDLPGISLEERQKWDEEREAAAIRDFGTIKPSDIEAAFDNIIAPKEPKDRQSPGNRPE
jgi:hypothetical protein